MHANKTTHAHSCPQARQLQEWAHELHQRLSLSPHKKLQLPPSVTQRHLGLNAALDSVDLEGDGSTLPLCWDVQASSSGDLVDSSSNSNRGNGGRLGGGGGLGRVLDTEFLDAGTEFLDAGASRTGSGRVSTGSNADAGVVGQSNISATAGRRLGYVPLEDRPCLIPSDGGANPASPAEVLFSFIGELACR